MSRKIKRTLRLMKESPRNVRFGDLGRVCEYYFGRTPWAGDPRVNIQEGPNAMAKVFQIRQVLAAIKRIDKEHEPKK
jgi:hypothetical protein